MEGTTSTTSCSICGGDGKRYCLSTNMGYYGEYIFTLSGTTDSCSGCGKTLTSGSTVYMGQAKCYTCGNISGTGGTHCSSSCARKSASYGTCYYTVSCSTCGGDGSISDFSSARLYFISFILFT